MTDPEGKIVEYEPSMAEEIAEMFNKFKELWPGGFGGGVPFDEERVKDWMDESSSIADFIAVDENGIPVGHCGLTPHWREDDAAYVYLLGVTPRVQGKRYGKRLLLKTIERAIQEGIKRVDLHTWSGNLNAMPLYKKVGMFWVPDTTVYMQDYIPLLHQNDLTKEWFEIHEDWYAAQERELEQEPDEFSMDDMDVFPYRFEEGEDLLEVDIDRYGWGITAVRKKLGSDELSIKAKVESHDIFMGIENRYTIEVENKTGEDKEIGLDVEPFDGLRFKERFPSSIEVENGERRKVSRAFVVDKEAKTFESAHKIAESIKTDVKIGEKRFTLTTGGRIKPAVEIDSQRDLDKVFSRKEEDVYFDLKNNTERVLSGKIDYDLCGKKDTIEFDLEDKETDGFELPVDIDFQDPVEYVEFTPSIEKEDGYFEMEKYRHPLVKDDNDILAVAEGEDEVYLLNSKMKVKAELEGGDLVIEEGTRGLELPFGLSEEVGPPFGKSQDKTLRFDHEVKREESETQLILRAESRHKPGIQIEKHVKLQKHSEEMEVWLELTNVSKDPIDAAAKLDTQKWDFATSAHQAKAKIYTPLGDKLIESDPVLDMISGTLVTTDPKEWKETWTAYEDVGDGSISGLIWEKRDLKKIKVWNGMLTDLKTVTKELEPEESFELPHVWAAIKKPSVNSFRDTWNRLVGKKNIEPNERMYGKSRRENIEVELDHNILEKGREVQRKILVDKVTDYPLPGEYSLRFEGELDGSFSNGKKRIKITEDEEDQKLELDISIDVPEEMETSVDEFTLHLSGKMELDFQIPVIVKGDGEVTVEEEKREGKKVLHVDNGKISFDVSGELGGNLIGLKDSKGNTYLDDNFPEPEPKSYFENHLGGIEPRLLTPEDLMSFYEIEDVSSKEITENGWRGVEVDFSIEELSALRGQRFTVKYLTLPETEMINITVEHIDPDDREVEWLGEFMFDVLLNGSLEDTRVISSGKYSDHERIQTDEQFAPPANVKEPWFFFERHDQSLGAFAVEDSKAYSSVICNKEINMGFLMARSVSRGLKEEKESFGIILDEPEDKVNIARRALKRYD